MAGTEEDVFVAAIDQGTTSTRFIIYDRNATQIASYQVEFTQFYPAAGYDFHLVLLFLPLISFFLSLLESLSFLTVIYLVNLRLWHPTDTSPRGLSLIVKIYISLDY
jgi:hypothetical protein